MRRVTSFLVAGVVLMVGAQMASANFTVTGTKVAGAGALAGYDIWQMYVTNNGTNTPGSSGTDVQGLDLVVVTTDPTPVGLQPFWFWKTSNLGGGNVSADGKAIFAAVDADPNAVSYIDGANHRGFQSGDSFGSATNKGQGTFLGLVATASGPGMTGVEYTPNNSKWLSGTQSPDASSPNFTTYSTTKTFRTAGGFTYGTAVNDRLLGTVRFGNIIVPTGNNFSLSGAFGSVFAGSKVGTGSDPRFDVTFSTAVPEPASLGLVAIGMLALGRRRRTA